MAEDGSSGCRRRGRARGPGRRSLREDGDQGGAHAAEGCGICWECAEDGLVGGADGLVEAGGDGAGYAAAPLAGVEQWIWVGCARGLRCGLAEGCGGRLRLARWLATSPAAAPPMPSQTTKAPSSGRAAQAS